MGSILPRISKRSVIVTGANGFIGQSLCSELVAAGWSVRGIVRRPEAAHVLPAGVEPLAISDMHGVESWRSALEGADAVVHLIGRAHVMKESGANVLTAYRKVNVDVTRCVLDACLQVGVRRLVYLSSIKAVGEGAAEAYTETSECVPENAYGISKREAEQLISERTEDTALEGVILRPPVVYGPGVKGNIERMMKLSRSGLPLPIRCLKARRSMVYVSNLVDAIQRMLASESPVQGIYHIADAEEPLSTRELLVTLAKQMGKRVLEVPVPATLLRMAGRLVGMGEEVARLTQPLVTRGTRLADELGWSPSYSREEGIRAMVECFVQQYEGRE